MALELICCEECWILSQDCEQCLCWLADEELAFVGRCVLANCDVSLVLVLKGLMLVLEELRNFRLA